MPAKTKPKATEPKAEPKPAKAPEPHEINSSLGSDRMKALLDDHRKMGARQ